MPPQESFGAFNQCRLALPSLINAATDAERGCDVHIEVEGKSESSAIPI
jgi:hypothetical protein